MLNSELVSLIRPVLPVQSSVGGVTSLGIVGVMTGSNPVAGSSFVFVFVVVFRRLKMQFLKVLTQCEDKQSIIFVHSNFA